MGPSGEKENTISQSEVFFGVVWLISFERALSCSHYTWKADWNINGALLCDKSSHCDSCSYESHTRIKHNSSTYSNTNIQYSKRYIITDYIAAKF